MSGVLNVLAASSPNGVRYSVTLAASSSRYGFSSGEGYGSISSTAFKDRTITSVHGGQNTGSDYGFSFSVNYFVEGSGSAVPQDYFRSIWVQGTNGAWSVFHSADAAVFSLNIWSWNPPESFSSPWTAATPSPREIIVIP